LSTLRNGRDEPEDEFEFGAGEEGEEIDSFEEADTAGVEAEAAGLPVTTDAALAAAITAPGEAAN